MNSSSARLHIVDALRGFAIVSIMLLHNLEHFDYYFIPAGLPVWMQTLDSFIMDSMFFLFGGKSYAIFALLFGLTFFIQSDNQKKKGKDFRLRFAWRLALLLLFGLINSAFYEGDILMIYAALGFSLIPVAKLNNKVVFIIAAVFMFQPYEWINFVWGIQNQNAVLADPGSSVYFGNIKEYIEGNSIINTLFGNLTNGRKAIILWNWENGRFFQTISLFMLGMLAGRKSLFKISDENKKFWKTVLIVSAIAFIPLFIIKDSLGGWIESEAIKRPLLTIETTWSNLAFMFILVSGFVLLFQTKVFYRILNVFSSYGKMSLSNYIIQSIIGSFIYYGFGLGLYKYTGATYCLLIGIVLAILQGFFSSWWMKNHKQGPLETIWHKLTWIGTGK
ncbi:MAG: DUF418 domain-containing protein [Ignavibacteria bacterium]|nr:DUF418 domain-containing protein [Ignavibacteria bacterium]